MAQTRSTWFVSRVVDHLGMFSLLFLLCGGAVNGVRSLAGVCPSTGTCLPWAHTPVLTASSLWSQQWGFYGIFGARKQSGILEGGLDITRF